MRTALSLISCCLLISCSISEAPVPAPTASTRPPGPHAELQAYSARQALEDMAAGRLDEKALTGRYLERIDALDDRGPKLRAVIELNSQAAELARAAAQARRSGQTLGRLHGLPILVKDNIDVAGLVTSAGSLGLAEHRPASDAPMVHRLRRAGGLILGKTNLSEWANFRSSQSSSGWSSRGGQTRNPHVLDRSPCGSSSGSAAAVAAGFAALAIGTETDGSIICPAAVNGIVGLKPTLGLVSRTGIVPISPSQDSAGPMAQTVADAALLLSAMVGVDPADPITEAAAAWEGHDYTEHLDTTALRGARIGVMRKTMGFHPEVDRVMEASLAALRAAGAVIVDPADLPSHGQYGEAEFEVLLSEFRPALEDYLRASSAPLGSLQAIIEFNNDHSGSTMPWFGQDLFLQAQAKPGIEDEHYLLAREKARRLAGPEGIDAILAAEQLDALIAPAVSPAWAIDLVIGDHFLGAGYGAAAVAGYPSITVPAGESHGLPIGIVLLGPAFSEPRLIGLAYAFEQATEARRPPAWKPSLE